MYCAAKGDIRTNIVELKLLAKDRRVPEPVLQKGLGVER
jgi:hypothetical protein